MGVNEVSSTSQILIRIPLSLCLDHLRYMMNTTLQHFSHPKHPLVLKKDGVLGVDARCYVCAKAVTVTDSPTYTCTSDDIDCQGLYVHKSCAEFPKQINHENHNQHPLTLRPPLFEWPCDVCLGDVKFAYYCELCDFVLCVCCAFEERVLRHQGHPEHTLQLMHRKVLFQCDACYEEAKDSSYVCTTCEFWIHKECALAELIIRRPSIHHHALHLIYSIPDMHRYFERCCAICEELVQKNSWLYYCHKCTYMVHVKCVARSDDSVSMLDNSQDTDNKSDLVVFPLPTEESLLDLILTQCGNTIRTASTLPDEPDIIEEHWSHKIHPLKRLLFSIGENANSDNSDGKRVLICDGCIQPITATYPSYYACIQCGFFLHSFCAIQMPLELPAGASSFHPQHILLLKKTDRFYNLVKCGVCWFDTNGFYYHCEPCNIKIDVRCAFLPVRIKHKSHEHHSLVQRPVPEWTRPICSLTKYTIFGGVEYACETCSSFQIHILCLFYPTIVKHKYDLHPVSLRYPPFFYEGVFYCEICEDQVNNQRWLYHCGQCDQSFHTDCIHWYESIKFGGTIELTITNQSHTLAFVLKGSETKISPMYSCGICGTSCDFNYFLECGGCGLLLCCECVPELQNRITGV